jgi:hypothetical protein
MATPAPLPPDSSSPPSTPPAANCKATATPLPADMNSSTTAQRRSKHRIRAAPLNQSSDMGDAQGGHPPPASSAVWRLNSDPVRTETQRNADHVQSPMVTSLTPT